MNRASSTHPAVTQAAELPAVASAVPSGVGALLRDLVALTKPTITGLVVLTMATTLYVPVGAEPSGTLVFFALLGTALASAAASSLNHYFDRDIDAMMARTRSRPVPSGRVSPVAALAMGLALTVVSTALLTVTVNVLTAALGLFAIFFYVVVYTLWLKRKTTQNIVIGGAAGAIPPLMGWAAATGTIEWPALLLFLLVFLWTPPHFWSLALYRKYDYAKAGVPMLPVVRGDEATRRQILVYAIVLGLAAVSLYPLRMAGGIYLAGAVALSGAFVWLAVRVHRERTVPAERRLFLFSSIYLALLFMTLALDRQILA